MFNLRVTKCIIWFHTMYDSDGRTGRTFFLHEITGRGSVSFPSYEQKTKFEKKNIHLTRVMSKRKSRQFDVKGLHKLCTNTPAYPNKVLRFSTIYIYIYSGVGPIQLFATITLGRVRSRISKRIKK